MRWQTKYSSAEMAFLEVVGDDAVYYIDLPRNVEGRWSLVSVAAGDADAAIRIPFGDSVLAELKAVAAERVAARTSADREES